MTRSVRLVERRTAVRRLPRADVMALLADWPHVVEVVPTHRRGWYRLTARGWAVTFRTPNRCWEVVPKLGWEAAGRLLGEVRLGDGTVAPGDGIRSGLATRLAALMAERATAGLVRGYADQPEHSAIVRGRIDFAASGRRPAVGFTQTVNDFTADQPWNGWPVAVAERLLAGLLAPNARVELRSAVEAFVDVRPHPSPAADMLSDLRLAAYRPLLDWCEVVDQTLAGGGLLVNLERLFESYLSRLLARPLGGRMAAPQREVLIRGRSGQLGVELRPDLTVLDAVGRSVAVWDVKWKALSAGGPKPDDLHQALGYAAALGVRTAGLLYPGRRLTARRYVTPGGVAVTVATCRLTGSAGQVARAEQSLRRLVLRA